MKNIFRSALSAALVLIAGFAVSCTETKDGNDQYQGIPTISVTPASVTVPLAGGTTEPVVVTTPAEWTLSIDADGVVASSTSGYGEGAVTFEVPAATAMRTIKVTFTATGYVSGFPITKKASLAISQSDSDIPSVDGAFVYYDNCGSAVSKDASGYWPKVDVYTGWAPTGGEGFDQSGVTYTGKNASVRNSGKTWAPVGATYATDAPYAYLQAKTDTEFVINNINIKNGVKNYTFSFTAFNQYASLIASPYTPVTTPLVSGENLSVLVSVDGQNWGAVAFSTMADGNWTYAIAPFTLPADASKLYVKFNNYVADTTTALPDATYQYQAALRFDDFRLVEGGDGPVVDFNIVGGGSTGGGNLGADAIPVTVAEFLNAAEDATIYYELTGVISNVANTTYGNFDLTDETGTVYIYGLSSPSGAQKYWAESGAKAGDTITLRTVRTSYNGTPQGKDAIFVSLVPGEGGDEEPTPAPAEGAFASDVAFVCSADDPTNAVYSLGSTTISGQAATGFKLGKSKQQGKFTSKAVGVSGDKYLNFYAVAWKSTTATLYFRVDGGAVQSVSLAGNEGATGNPPYVSLNYATSDHDSVKLEGLTATSTIEFGTNADFAFTTHGGSAPDIAPRVIVCGVKLTDEPVDTENPGGDQPGDGGEQPGDGGEQPEQPTGVVTIADILALGSGASINSASIEGIVISNMDLNNLTSKKGMYVQDATGALQFYLAANHEFAFGTKVQIDLSGATLGSYNGAVQISGLALDKITTVSTGNTVEPKTVTMADFLANKYEGQYVALEGVQVASSDLANTWVMGGAHTSINMEDAAGNKFVVFSSKYASYGAETVAQGAGTIKGIASINNGNMQIIFAQAGDYAGLTGARFDSTTPEPEPDPTPDPTPGNPVASITSDLNSSLTWADETDATHGVGKYTMIEGVKVAYYIGGNTSDLRTPDADHIRVYQNGVFSITPVSGQKVTSVTMTTTAAKYAIDVNVNGAEAAKGDGADKITWTGSVEKFVATPSAQIRIKNIVVTFE